VLSNTPWASGGPGEDAGGVLSGAACDAFSPTCAIHVEGVSLAAPPLRRPRPRIGWMELCSAVLRPLSACRFCLLVLLLLWRLRTL
jgi:hypothetical protein